MLVIRREQMEALAQATMQHFVRGRVRHLETHFGRHLTGHGLTGPRLEAAVQSGIADAQRYGVVFEHDIARYLEFVALLGPAFDEDPVNDWAEDILQRDDLDGTAKVNRISDYLIFVANEAPI
jgi:hypothetical protein